MHSKGATGPARSGECKMKATTSVQMGQQLHLTPQLLQSIRLLQLDAQQLQMEVARVLEQNPMLELDEEAVATAADGGEIDPAGEAAIETAAFDELPESSMWDVAGASWSGEGEDRMQRIADAGSSDPCVRVLQRLALELEGQQLEIAGFWLEQPRKGFDYKNLAQVGPQLKRRGMIFVGLDVIGDWLTEINVTSPTCIRELDAQFGLNIAGSLFDCIEARLA